MVSVAGGTVKKSKLLFFVTEDWYFCSHRLSLGKAALEAGFEVVLVTNVQAHREVIESLGIRIVPLQQQRGGLNPFREVKVLFSLLQIYHQEQPDLVHHIAVKPVLYGSLVARWLGLPCQVNALTGLGWIYSSKRWFPRILGLGLTQLLRILLQRGKVIVQNPDDQRWLSQLGVPTVNIRLILGSGVDLQEFQPARQSGPFIPVVMLVARMLWDKGVGEFVEASTILRKRGLNVNFVLVGSPDKSNPASLTEKELLVWHKQKLIEWWGHREDISDCYSNADIACLPSYREGLPKSLLEAAACGLPIVTTNTPGCREVVRHMDNGLLVSVRDALDLADALEILLKDEQLRNKMGKKSREIAEKKFSIESVVEQTLNVYKEFLP
jgi:glycosyltransferase involved in cell wall biosynthesis